jgi:predicted O-methyltransferase YrrM
MRAIFLDTLAASEVAVGYGTVGCGGRLGYERKRVIVGGAICPHALSTHPPARLRYALDGRADSFRSRVALNDDVPPGISSARFCVVVDGQLVASQLVVAGDPAALIEADVCAASELELIVETDAWAHCHAVWLDPHLLVLPATPALNGHAATEQALDRLPLLASTVGFGSLGREGALGYEDKQVIVAGQPQPLALSAHAPSTLTFDLGGRYSRFRCEVALNDDVPAGASHAHFLVLADDRMVAQAPYVAAGDGLVAIEADVRGAQTLTLDARTSRWVYAHAVWIDPRVDDGVAGLSATTLRDCLDRAEICLPPHIPHARRCVATTVSPGFAHHLDDMLGSLLANGGCHDALLAVFAVDADDECRRVARKYGAVVIECNHLARVNSTVKSILYSAARVIDAEQFVCLDADMLVTGDLQPVFAMIDACPEGSILACREGNGPSYTHIEQALCSVYGGRSSDIARIIGTNNGEGRYPLVVNDGIFAGSRVALLTLDGVIRRWTAAPAWVDERRNVWWRNQLVFNLALAHLNCGVELSERYNIQLNSQDADLTRSAGRLKALWHGHDASVLHFNGLGRDKYRAWRGLYGRVEHPLVGAGSGDGYGQFLDALRAWLGEQGLEALRWSFYGTANASSAAVRDPATFPMLALLHYLVRANGCVRVLETGTARGISAACLASAVAHRAGGRVVSLDPFDHPGRSELWDMLPPAMAACLEQRPIDSIAGMAAAHEDGERFDAILIDSLHEAEHVWNEFQLATKLVCRGGLILIHDVCLATGTVDQAVARIEAAGYGVARLWAAESGEPEGDGLGLAVIENRRRSEPDCERSR